MSTAQDHIRSVTFRKRYISKKRGSHQFFSPVPLNGQAAGEEDLMTTFICYDRCGTCKKAEKWLQDNGISYVKRPIKEENPTAEELGRWKEESGLPLKRFFNTSGQLYRSMGLKDRLKDMDEEEQIRLLASDGMLVKRPILLVDDRVLVGFKETEWQALKNRT